MSITGEPDGHPVRTGVPLGDIGAGMYGAIGVLAALAQRDLTGKGQYIDVAMLDCQVAMLNYHAAYYLAGGKVPGRQGRGHDLIPTYRCFAARDGREVVVTCNTEPMWKAMCAVLGRPELSDDPLFRTNPDRQRNRAALAPLLEAAFLARDADDWVARLLDVGVPVATVNTVDRALADPHVNHRGMVLDLHGDRPGQQTRVTGNPVKMSGLPDPSYPPGNGEDTRAVLHALLGLDDAEIDGLKARGVIAEATEQAAS
jgi:CoA:oxalate CoA-transferase